MSSEVDHSPQYTELDGCRVIHTFQPIPPRDGESVSIFLLGPSATSSGGCLVDWKDTWRGPVLKKILDTQAKNFGLPRKIDVFIPWTDKSKGKDFSSADVLKSEHEMLKASDYLVCVFDSVADKEKGSQGLVSRLEIAEWSVKRLMYVTIPDGAFRPDSVREHLKRTKTPVYAEIDAMIDQLARDISNHRLMARRPKALTYSDGVLDPSILSERTYPMVEGAVLQVPSYLRTSQSVQRIFEVMKRNENTLVGCETGELIFIPCKSQIPGDEKNAKFRLPFGGSLKPVVAIGSEDGRIKQNESVVFRTETSHVIVHGWDPSTRSEAIFLTGEFRIPAMCCQIEPPGGSDFYTDDPRQIVVKELKEEMGLEGGKIDYVGTYRAGGMVGSCIHLFRRELSYQEILRVNDSIEKKEVFGESETDGSLQREEYVTLKKWNWMKDPVPGDMDLVTIGMIHAAMAGVVDRPTYQDGYYDDYYGSDREESGAESNSWIKVPTSEEVEKAWEDARLDKDTFSDCSQSDVLEADTEEDGDPVRKKTKFHYGTEFSSVKEKIALFEKLAEPPKI